MDLIISPYDISARSPAAMAAPLLAWPSGSVLTLRPEPLEGAERGAVSRAAAGVVGMARFLDSWRWTAGLWREGVLRARTERAEPIEAVRALCARIANEPHLAPLRPVVSAELFDDSESYLNALLRDLDRGGGDPKVTLPVQAGLEALAASLGVPVVRTHRPAVRPAAVGAPLFSFSLPMLAEADGDSVLELLHTTEPELAALDGALSRVVSDVLRTGAPPQPIPIDALKRACDGFARGFERSLPALRTHAEAAGDPFRACEASVYAELVEPGSSLEAAARGFGRMTGSPPPIRVGGDEPGLIKAGDRRLLVLSVKRLPFDTLPM